MKVVDKKHYYLRPISFSLYGLGIFLAFLNSIDVIPFEYGQILSFISFILSGLSYVLGIFIKPITIIEYYYDDWKVGGEDGRVITIPEELHKLGKRPSVDCKIVKNGIESNVVANIKLDSHGTIYVNSPQAQPEIRIIITGK
ncbi:MAG: hypothetical protein NXH90_15665 [Flavobacteriaceae bacterium]|nr:hypothetical protein [Flavobacteriaceae bacterium]